MGAAGVLVVRLAVKLVVKLVVVKRLAGDYTAEWATRMICGSCLEQQVYSVHLISGSRCPQLTGFTSTSVQILAPEGSLYR